MLLLVVIFGIAVAIFMIFESFVNWRENPISTTIETFPISEMTFPNVTVCPPRNLFLNLNYDLMKSNITSITSKSRIELIDYSLDVIQEEFYKEVMANLSKLEDPDRFYNWYHGYTSIRFPDYGFFEQNQRKTGRMAYTLTTSATSGNISTNIMDGNILIEIKVIPPTSVWGDSSTAMFVNIDKIKGIGMFSDPNYEELKELDRTNWSQNISVISLSKGGYWEEEYFFFIANSLEDEKLPAFRFSWKYNMHLKPDDITKIHGYQTGWTTEFRR